METSPRNRTKVLILGISQRVGLARSPCNETIVNKPHVHSQFLNNFLVDNIWFKQTSMEYQKGKESLCYDQDGQKIRTWQYVKSKAFREQRNKLLEMKIIIKDMNGI